MAGRLKPCSPEVSGRSPKLDANRSGAFMKLQDKVAVITGGNSGIGLATARVSKDNGARVVIFGRSRQTFDQAAESLGSDVLSVQGDARNLDILKRLFEQTARKVGKIDVLVANTGVAEFAPVDVLSKELFDELGDTPFKGGVLHGAEGAALDTRRSRRLGRRGQEGPRRHLNIHGSQSRGPLACALVVGGASFPRHPSHCGQPRDNRHADHYA